MSFFRANCFEILDYLNERPARFAVDNDVGHAFSGAGNRSPVFSRLASGKKEAGDCQEYKMQQCIAALYSLCKFQCRDHGPRLVASCTPELLRECQVLKGSFVLHDLLELALDEHLDARDVFSFEQDPQGLFQDL